ncbi:MAG: hypothetical protein OEM62_10650, partial [Acidobacteriota bacterium]|nr:hypothetical protein [Acidobacteriota bacterium]
MTSSVLMKSVFDATRITACRGLRLSCLVAGAAVVLGLAPAPIAAQCPVPPSTAPVVDGVIDSVYFERGVTTDYITATGGATASLYQIDDVCVDSQFIYLVWEIDLGFVDNSYGLNRNQGSTFPWPKGHSFADLTESDKQRLQILNVCGEDVVDLAMDYIDGPNVPGPEYDTPSGYEPAQPASCAGALCGETAKILINGGDWTKFIYDTSLANNLNDLGFCTNDGVGGSAADCSVAGTDLLVDSPPWADEDNYIPQSPYDEWEYRHLYEMRIDRSVFSTASCPQGTPALIRTDPVELHASPSKTGQSPAELVRAYSTIGDYVWLDADRDGVQDAGESGLANVTIELYTDADGDGVFEPDTPVVAG